MSAASLALQILKFVAILVGSTAGLLGTVRDTKDRNSGDLTPSGKWLVCALLLSAVVAFSSQSVETYLAYHGSVARDSVRREDDKRMAKLLKGVRDASQRLDDVTTQQQLQLTGQDSLLRQASRQLTPLYPLEVHLRLAYPRTYTGFAAYLTWLERRYTRPDELCFSLTVSSNSPDAPDDKRDSREFPATVLTRPWIELEFYRDGNVRRDKPDLVLMGGMNDVSPTLRAMASSLSYVAASQFDLDCLHSGAPIVQSTTLANPLIERDNGLIQSFLDLDRATLVIDITNSREAGGAVRRSPSSSSRGAG